MKKALLVAVAVLVPVLWPEQFGFTLGVLIALSPAWLPLLLIILGLRHRRSARRTGQPVHQLWRHIGLALQTWRKPHVTAPAPAATPSIPAVPIRPAPVPPARPRPQAVRRPAPVLGGVDDADAVGTAIEFTYMDTEGEVTIRRVDVHAVTDYYIRGYCRKRRATRTFRLDRVIGDITDLDTGELIKPETWRRRVRT